MVFLILNVMMILFLVILVILILLDPSCYLFDLFYDVTSNIIINIFLDFYNLSAKLLIDLSYFIITM